MLRPQYLRSTAVHPLLAILLLTTGASAQPLRPGVLQGRVLAASGGSVRQPVIRVSRGATIHLEEGEADGDFRIEGIDVGRWQVSVRREGFAPLVIEIEMPAGGMRRDFTLIESAGTLDSAILASGWAGVRGSVNDSRGNAALAGASLRLMGTETTASSDSTGRFALPLTAGRDFILRVGRTGYATRLVTGRVPTNGYSVVEVPLDTSDADGRDYWIWRDLERRLKYATPRAARMTRAEIEETRASSLGSAIEGGRSVAGRGLVITNSSCLFVDGLPRPGATVDAIRASDVEFLEAYPEGTDLTRTLASRWPANAVCGAGNLSSQKPDWRREAHYVVVWLRAP
jgi:hypothetical protein